MYTVPGKGPLYLSGVIYLNQVSVFLSISRNEHERVQIQVGWRRLGSTRPRADAASGSGTNQASGSLSSLSRKAKNVELKRVNLGTTDLRVRLWILISVFF